MSTLVIVESPGKVKKISASLGSEYRVMASVGHVRDLPAKEIGVEAPDFKPNYVPTERGSEILNKLKAAVAKSNRVLLATDPDREGEAIAWHLADALALENAERITFSAITDEQVKAAILAPRAINMNLVHAQEARRVLDRIVGYRVSPALSDKSGQRLSAGRVQSPAVRLVVDRERVIKNFKVTQHYGVELIFGQENSWKAIWDVKPHVAEGESYLLDESLAQRVSKIRDVKVVEFEDSEKGQPPPAPFTTSMLQQEAGKKLKFKPKKTMELAQKLYEQGAITYHRTDSPNMDEAGVEDIAQYAQSVGLPITEKPRKWKSKEGAQEGHEAIRPTHAVDKDLGETDDEKLLYQLIWKRAIACQLADAMYAVRTTKLASKLDDMQVFFKASGKTLLSQGWLIIYSDDHNIDDEKEEAIESANNQIPALAINSEIIADDGKLLVKKTKPPTRFKEETLVAEMERLGIGRPSTYAAILDNITARTYVTHDAKGFLVPSSIGELVRDSLVGHFEFSDLNYTKEIEEQLDLLAEGKIDYRAVVSAAWDVLSQELSKVEINLPVANPCPNCGKNLARRKGAFGHFWACTAYPECKTTLPDDNGKIGVKKVSPTTSSGVACPKCSKDLVRRQGKSKAKGTPYDFYSCSGYPKCDATYKVNSEGKPIF